MEMTVFQPRPEKSAAVNANSFQLSPALQGLADGGASVIAVHSIADVASMVPPSGVVVYPLEGEEMALPFRMPQEGESVEDCLMDCLEGMEPLEVFLQGSQGTGANTTYYAVAEQQPSATPTTTASDVDAESQVLHGHTIPADALGTLSPEQAEQLIAAGKVLLDKIAHCSEAELETNSPIHSTADMAAILWALTALALGIDDNFQRSSSAMTVPDGNLYQAMAGATTADGAKLCYDRGGTGKSTHLKPFPNSKKTQLGVDIKDEPLPYGKGTVLIGLVRKDETGFPNDLTYVKMEAHGIQTIWDMLNHLINLIQTTFHKVTRDEDFREKTTKISKHIATFLKADPPPAGISAGDLSSAAAKGLTALARCRQNLAQSGAADKWLTRLDASVDKMLDEKVLKQYQRNAIGEWRQSHPQGSTLLYFAEQQQIGAEMALPPVQSP
jgi:hypothetical protein